ncbi:regulator medusa [Teratosphaeria destructans]|uniref:Regulator medusa n=1 Tax=Teratosphaeria destructans TaxID=418781 RepID=A0A9W7W6D4_9PEZI|nr:regulator medusa [Teratosphaeria destructans]
MRQHERRDSKSFLIVDEDCGIPTSIVDSYHSHGDNGPLAQSDPRGYLLSMSEYEKPQAYDVYGGKFKLQIAHVPSCLTTSAVIRADYGIAHLYVGSQASVPSGLPQSTALPMVPSAQQYGGTHDSAYYGQQYAQQSVYSSTVPRQKPEIISWTPERGHEGTKVTLYFKSIYDLDAPQIKACLMFGSAKIESTLSRTAQVGNMYTYELSAPAPSLRSTNSPDEYAPLHLIFDDSPVAWESASLELGDFHYVDATACYPQDSPQEPKKRKLSPQASPRRSPPKKPSLHHLSYSSTPIPSATPASPFRRPSLPDVYTQHRRIGSNPQEYQPAYSAPLPSAQQYYGQTTPSLQGLHSPSWYNQGNTATRSPSAAAMSAASRTPNLLPSPAGPNPPLVRTSTLQNSPSTPGSTVTPSFNPYAIYPSNSKAVLSIQGDLNSMVNDWTSAEWETRRRLVQFRRSQTGSVITATFEPVTLETRVPNSICVSCIWWEEKQECYVTSVDTISLLESLVAVRFTVEEKNRIRRNLEGFRPATVSKAKPDSEEFFKLIMGFPNPKPRNIEKDVKVFPWRILATALKKIIGKYASVGIGPSGGPPDLRLGVPVSDAGHSTSWHQPQAAYSSDLSAARQNSASWEYNSYLGGSPATGLPSSAHAYAYQQPHMSQSPRYPSLTSSQAGMLPTMEAGRFVPLQDYEAQHGQPTSTAQH